MASLKCDIVTPQAKFYSDEAYFVVVPGVEGEMGYLPGHAQTVTVLADGVVRVQNENGGDFKRFALQGGYAQVTGEKVIILADRALPVEDIDVAAVTAELAELEAKQGAMSEEEALKTTIALDIAWCNTQIKAATAK